MSERHPEHQYLDLLSHVLELGDERLDRTGVGTRSLFGAMVRFGLSEGRVPILTTNRVYWKTAVREMLWFLTGGTNIQPLLRENVRIRTDWPLAAYKRETSEDISQKDFEQRVLGYDTFAARWGELGPVYGKQWRRWLGTDGREHDQIADLLRTLRENPASRRMIFHGWNVAELDTMALPPCHMVYQYHVTSDGKLNCPLFQRSVDLLLGAAFNFVGATVLQQMLAQQARLTPGELVWMGGDVHLYRELAAGMRDLTADCWSTTERGGWLNDSDENSGHRRVRAQVPDPQAQSFSSDRLASSTNHCSGRAVVQGLPG